MAKTKTKKYAVETYYRDENGKLMTVLVDAATGQPISDTKGYDVVTQDQLDSGALGLSGTLDLGTGDEGDVLDTTKKSSGNTSFGDTKKTLPRTFEGGRNNSFGSTKGNGRTVANDFGYQHKPAITAAASFLPGPLGMAGKALNLGWDYSNKVATKKATEMTGAKPKKEGNFIDHVISTITGNDQGMAGQVKIGDHIYDVSLDQKNAPNSLTPMEAVHRQEAYAKQHGLNPADVQGKTFGPTSQPSKTAQSTSTSTTSTPQRVRNDVTDTVQRTSNVSYSNQRAQRNQPLNPDTEAKLSEAAKSYFGPDYEVDVSSGKGVMRDKNGNPSKKGNHNHPLGTAGDFSVRNKVTGETVTGAQLADFGAYAATKGFTGIGMAKDYMGLDKMHLDTNHPKTTVWGGPTGPYQGLQESVNTNIERGFGLPGPGAPTPTARPSNAQPSVRTGFSTVPEKPAQTVAQGIINQAKTPGNLDKLGFNPYSASPAALANAGMLGAKTEAQRNQINLAIAGELGPNTLKGLKENNPTALAEYANMRATIENRYAKVGDLGTVLDGSQYNSMLSKNLGTTIGNYKTYKDVLDQAYTAFDEGTVKATNPNANSYFNPNEVNPGWSNSSFSMTGEHKFGSVSNWSKYNQDFYAERKDAANKANLASAQGYSGSFGNFGRTDTPHSGSYRPASGGGDFGNYTGGYKSGTVSSYSGSGGHDSPSEGGSRFGGSGLGSSGTGSVGSGGNFGRGDTPSSGKSSFGGSVGSGKSTGTGSSNMGRSDTPSSGKSSSSSFGGSKSSDKDGHAGRAGF